MKYLLLFFLGLIISCSEDEAPKLDCRLTKITVTGKNSIAQTTYTYNSSGKIDRQVRTINGTTIFDYRYSYNSAGKVDRVDFGDSYTQFEYTTDGKIANQIGYSNTGTINGKFIYVWSGNNVEIKYTQPAKPNPIQSTTLEFLNDNLIKRSFKSFTGNEPNVLLILHETYYEDFDTALSEFYVANPARPGFTAEISKNNPRKQIDISISYTGGVITQESTSTTILSYTYNASNAVVTSKATTNGTDVIDTMITYDQCD